MSHRPAWSAGMRPSKPVLTIFSVSPSFLTTAWYDSTSNPTGVVGAAGSKNSIGEYSMSTQFDSSPGLSSDVGAAIPEALGATLGATLAGSLAAGTLATADGAAALGDAAAPLVQADATRPIAASHLSRVVR